MLLKLGVDISRLKPEIRKRLPIIETIWEQVTDREPVITSTYEGDHSVGSLHYANLAVDFRKNVNGAFLGTLLTRLRSQLGRDYDVVKEASHIHIEYDPKETR